MELDIKKLKEYVFIPVIHNKTGNTYYIINKIINCTNKMHDCEMILYMNTEGKMFCREVPEFLEKFTIKTGS